MRRFACGAAVLTILALGSSIAEAQGAGGPFEQLRRRVSAGDTITVTDVNGHTTQGAVAELSPSSLALLLGADRIEFGAAEVETVSRRDSRRNGVLWGLGLGAILGAWQDWALVDAYGRDDIGVGSSVAFIATCAGIGAGIGFAVDALIRGQDLIYSRPGTSATIEPMWEPRRKGVSLSLRF